MKSRKQNTQFSHQQPERKYAELSHKNTIAAFISPPTNTTSNPWSPEDVDQMEVKDPHVLFKETVKDCRFFYKRDAIASVVINKLVEISINDIIFNKNGLSDNQLGIFKGLKESLKTFAEEMALEYLISGLVIPEYKFTAVNKEVLEQYEIKKYTSLQLPTSMWIRDPATVEIKHSLLGNEPTYVIEIPKEVIAFIMANGKYDDGTEDPELFAKLKAEYPNFILAVKDGKTKVKLENKLVIRRKVVTGNPYPTPFLYPAMEDLKHKRNLRRMDYSVASRVISAIQLFKLGSDEFPVTEDDTSVFEDIKNQMFWRDSGRRDLERIFQLFANHTLEIEWVFPPVDVLLDDTKYLEVNKDIIMALGVAKTLLVGEAERSNTSDPELSTVSAVKTMENFRNYILKVIRQICIDVSTRNKLSSAPVVRFKPLNLVQFKEFALALEGLYASGNLSREEYAEYFGYDWNDSMDAKEEEQKILKKKKLGEFAPAQFSPAPGAPGTNPAAPAKPNNDKTKIPENSK